MADYWHSQVREIHLLSATLQPTLTVLDLWLLNGGVAQPPPVDLSSPNYLHNYPSLLAHLSAEILLGRHEELPPDAPFPHFRSMRMKLAWLSNTRPDCLFEISQLAQVTEEKYRTEGSVVIRRINRAIRYAVQNRISLKVPSLNKDTLRVIGFSDSSFANNTDLSSQLGHICLLGDHSGAVVPINFKSYKSRRVTRSSMAGEVIAFSDLFDVATTLASELELILSHKVPVQLFTDIKSLFDVISKGSRTSEKRMMLDIAAAREGFKNKTISDIGFVRSSKNIADGLTKHMSQAVLRQIIDSSMLDIQPEQWIVRK